jgi:hypothetical protein
MRDPLGVDNRASKRVPAGSVSAAAGEEPKTTLAISNSRVAKCLNTTYTVSELCAATPLHGTLDELLRFPLPKSTTIIFFNNQSTTPLVTSIEANAPVHSHIVW